MEPWTIFDSLIGWIALKQQDACREKWIWGLCELCVLVVDGPTLHDFGRHNGQVELKYAKGYSVGWAFQYERWKISIFGSIDSTPVETWSKYIYNVKVNPH